MLRCRGLVPESQVAIDMTQKELLKLVEKRAAAKDFSEMQKLNDS